MAEGAHSPLVDALRSHDRALQRRSTSLAFDERMRRSIASGPPRRRRAWTHWLAAAAAVVMLLGAGSWWVMSNATGGGPDGPPEAVARFVGADVPITECQRDFEERVVHLRGRCTLELEEPGVTVQTWTRATVEPRRDGLVVHDGLVLVDVQKVQAGAAPVRVGVGGGSIEVLGTQFVIYEGTSGGEVELLEGAIRFSRTDGPAIEMEVGDRTRWAAPPETPELVPMIVPAPAPTPVPTIPATDNEAPAPEPAPTRAKRVDSASAEDLNATLVEVARLRERGQYHDALTQLREFRRSVRLPRTMAEVVSFEEGSLLEAKGATAEACEHWARHTRRFSKGQYDAEVQRHSTRLGCAHEPGGN